jgi:hypothetical protein
LLDGVPVDYLPNGDHDFIMTLVCASLVSINFAFESIEPASDGAQFGREEILQNFSGVFNRSHRHL